MNTLNETNATVEENNLEEAYQTYRLLKEEIKEWQEERGSFWLQNLKITEAPPYYPLANLPADAIFELWVRLNRVMEEEVSDSDLKDAWQNLKAGRGIQKAWLQSTLQLALSGLAQLVRIMLNSRFEDNIQFRNSISEHEHESEENQNRCCPICGEKAVLSVLIPPHGKRFLHCIFCGQEWPVMRTGCILCGRDEASSQNYLRAKEYPGVELVTCESCGQFFKEFDLRLLTAEDLVWEDVRTLPLNYAGEHWVADHRTSVKTQ
ncbi:uncharacterized protein involved in formate dehydrogenase formation [Desulfosporosinus acidiphilus SJ4]|uniref:Uncharacterized protein involved in formate dehydrogenase formation n=1 Tax=Desulfosporosinus acidiphilus (strain DSM 22704 / JCM 16185 / SJ4) TaxID=646529 RepID=I4D5Z0_DESAJ|nr:formate dehydrogenase accessory protein FdhE [Desulfosporosinus acidiphilus]AFM41214.1 uncharacterized protein involved in formate dehydrogenase formation [Desulfosporosinus acidiphilus SJ4]